LTEEGQKGLLNIREVRVRRSAPFFPKETANDSYDFACQSLIPKMVFNETTRLTVEAKPQNEQQLQYFPFYPLPSTACQNISCYPLQNMCLFLIVVFVL
jgi:hypothetical protein